MGKEVAVKTPPEVTNDQIALLKEGATLIRLENQTQMAVAIQRPRDEEKILADALRELELYPSMAEETLYVKPVGKDDQGNKKYAEGLSIRTAESLANRWSNSAYGCDIIGDDGTDVTLAAVFLDYENNTRHVIQKKVSRFYKGRDGKVNQHSPDRFADLVVPANQSKLLREAILRSLPAGLKKEYENKAREVMKDGKRKPDRVKRMLAAFENLLVSKEMIEKFLDKSTDKLTTEEINRMVGIHNSIRDGDSTIEDVFGVKATQQAATPQSSLKVQQPKPEAKEDFFGDVAIVDKATNKFLSDVNELAEKMTQEQFKTFLYEKRIENVSKILPAGREKFVADLKKAVASK